MGGTFLFWAIALGILAFGMYLSGGISRRPTTRGNDTSWWGGDGGSGDGGSAGGGCDGGGD